MCKANFNDQPEISETFLIRYSFEKWIGGVIPEAVARIAQVISPW